MSISEKGFGARVSNAQDLLTHLKSFSGYLPPSQDLSVTALEALIAEIKQHNDVTISAISNYSDAVDEREKLFKKEPASLFKLLSPINASAVAALGKKSKQAENIMTLTRKIRGKKIKKLGKDPDAATISQSEGSYGSLAQSLADLIVILDGYSNTYTPSNENITISALQELYTAMQNGAKNVTAALGLQKRCRDLRAKNYEELNIITQRIKEAVKGQYTASSTEYKLIKSLSI
ncbi:hypothetical protein F0919_15990 [Taibaiella lutea]|uniref:Uncharacterized protein n=1 Tax=Taibaiella lutea TaxID=2608001 RepID=A0A5M6CAY9_9BACT|nr:hypothetical protein [Taibaiella lutea]KAA5532294.1 hypothetical protein F0919_15990 [Taibaiella lutea]